MSKKIHDRSGNRGYRRNDAEMDGIQVDILSRDNRSSESDLSDVSHYSQLDDYIRNRISWAEAHMVL